MTLDIEFGRARKDESVKVYIRVEHRGTRFREDTNVILNKNEYYIGKTGYKIRNLTKHSTIESKVQNLRSKIILEYGESLVMDNALNIARLFAPKQTPTHSIPTGDRLKVKMDNLMLSVDATDDPNSFHDFFEFFDGWYERCTAKGKKNYKTKLWIDKWVSQY